MTVMGFLLAFVFLVVGLVLGFILGVLGERHQEREKVVPSGVDTEEDKQ